MQVPGAQLLRKLGFQAEANLRNLVENQRQGAAQCRTVRIGAGEYGRRRPLSYVAEREQMVGQQEARIEPRRLGFVFWKVVRSDQRQTGLLRERTKHIHLRNNAQTDQQMAQAPAYRPLYFKGAVQIVAGYFLLPEQYLAKLRGLRSCGVRWASLGHGVHRPRLFLIA